MGESGEERLLAPFEHSLSTSSIATSVVDVERAKPSKKLSAQQLEQQKPISKASSCFNDELMTRQTLGKLEQILGNAPI